MKIAVLNGSPKGMTSVTMQYVHYIQKKFPEHDLNIICIHRKLKKMEKDAMVFREVMDEIESADGVLWAFPVYYMLVPGYYKRFIELIWERGAAPMFKDKHAAVLVTSIKFFDHAALYYMQAVCDDLGMRYHGSFSPEMYHLAKPEGKEKTRFFAENFFAGIRDNTSLPPSYPPITTRDFDYRQGSLPPGERIFDHTGNKKVLVLTDSRGDQPNLDKMVGRFIDAFPGQTELINLNDVETRGPCLGCIKCWYDHQCIIRDEFVAFMKEKVLAADILIFAGGIRDRFLSATWKIFLDRSFCNGHTAWLPGKQIGMIISGPFSQIPNIREIFQVFAEALDANLVGFVTDEFGDSETIDTLLEEMGQRLVNFSENNFVQPATFLGTASKLTFREVFWGRFRFPFVADYRQHFSKLGEDEEFPHKAYKTRFTNAVLMTLSHLPAFRRKMTKNMKQNLLIPLKGVLDD